MSRSASMHRPMRGALFAALLLACALPAPGCEPASRAPARRDAAFVAAWDAAPATRDPDADPDGDGYSLVQGDCDPDAPDVHPGAPETCDLRDENCDGRIDEDCDGDGDGYSPASGDCDDREALVNPGAFEATDNGVDDDCDGVVDEALPSCEQAAPVDAKGYASAMEVCGAWVKSAEWSAGADPRARAVTTAYGAALRPRHGHRMLVLSTGVADPRAPDWVDPQPGTGLGATTSNPFKLQSQNGNVCGKTSVDPDDVDDLVELKLVLRAPTNARSLSFRFYFLSTEYPEWVGSAFNDKFLAIATTKAVANGKPTNVSFDAQKNPITVNVGFFQVCRAAAICGGARQNACARPLDELAGSGYERDDGTGPAGGGTGWLKTTVPVSPGETLTLRFVLFDEGDGVLDSAVLLDDFAWQLQPAEGGPTTIP